MLIKTLKVLAATLGMMMGGFTFSTHAAEDVTPAGDKGIPKDRESVAGPSKQVTKVYPLKHALAEQVVALLRSLFLVVNEQEPYARFHFDPITTSLIVGAAVQHQSQVALTLAQVDTPDKAPVAAVEQNKQDPIVKGYRIEHADGEATVAILRSLFLVVNHQDAYARFAYDARRRLLIVIAAEKHQEQIAKVVVLLESKATPAKEPANDDEGHLVRIYPIKLVDGE